MRKPGIKSKIFALCLAAILALTEFVTVSFAADAEDAVDADMSFGTGEVAEWAFSTIPRRGMLSFSVFSL